MGTGTSIPVLAGMPKLGVWSLLKINLCILAVRVPFGVLAVDLA